MYGDSNFLVIPARQSGKSWLMRTYLLSWWIAWEGGYRGSMPYVIGPEWRPPKSNSGIAPICGRETPVPIGYIRRRRE